MAISIGEITAVLRAQVNGYIQATQQAATATGGLRVQSQLTQAQFEAANRRLQELEGTLTQAAPALDKLTEGARRAAPALKQVEARVESLGKNASRGLNMVRGAASALATQALGLPGALGQVSQGLLFFAAGSATVTGIVAGIAVIGMAWKALTKDTREQKEEIDGLLKKYLALAQQNLPIPDQIKNIEDEVAKLTAARRAFIVDAVGAVRVALAEAGGQGIRSSEFNEDQRETIRNFDRAIAAAQALRAETGSLNREMTISVKSAKTLAEEAEKLAQAWRDRVMTNLEKHAQAMAEINRLHAMGLLTTEQWEAATVLLADQYLKVKTELVEITDKMLMLAETSKATFEPMKAEAVEGLHTVRDEMEKTAAFGGQIGESVTRGLVGGILGRKKDVSRALVEVFERALEDVLAAIVKKGIVDAIINALTGGAGKVAGIAGGGGKVPILGDLPVIGGLFSARAMPSANPEGLARASGGGPSLSFHVMVPASNVNPITVARDAQWQEALKESLRVAEQQGWRLEYR